MKRFLPPLLLGLTLTLSACTTRPPAPPVPPPPTAAPSATATPTAEITPTPTPTPAAPPVWGNLTGEFRQTAVDKPDQILVEHKFTLPKIENPAEVDGYAAINLWYVKLLDALKGDAQASVAQAQDDYATAKSLGESFFGSQAEATYEVVYQSETTAAVLRTHYGYSGGPYPTLLYMTDRFDLESGAFLRFADFFTDPTKAEALVLEEVKRQGAGHAEYDQASIVSAFDRENFYPTEKGLLFYYQPQILNPSPSLKPEFLVPYSLLEGLLKR